MKRNIILTSIITLSFVMPAMADYDVNETYANSCTVGNLNVSSGQTDIATANFSPNTYTCNSGTYLAADGIECITCPAGSFCPGGTYTYNASAADGITACPSGYTSSDSGVSANTQCYTDCTTSMFAHSTAVTGRDYYGAGTDTCQITSCATGYSVDSSATSCVANTITVRWGDKDGNVHATNTCTYDGTLTTPTTAPTAPKGHHFTGWTFPAPTYDYTPLINTDADSERYKSINGTGTNSDDTTGLSNGEWEATWNSKGIAKGTSLCSSTNAPDMGATNPQPDETGTGDTRFCWCKLTGFNDTVNNVQYEQSSLWVFAYTNNSATFCADDCAYFCGTRVRRYPDFRPGMFGSVQ